MFSVTCHLKSPYAWYSPPGLPSPAMYPASGYLARVYAIVARQFFVPDLNWSADAIHEGNMNNPGTAQATASLPVLRVAVSRR